MLFNYIFRLIAEGKGSGYWVFLANCHLSLSWMPALDKIVELLQSDPELHPDFRLVVLLVKTLQANHNNNFHK